MSLRDDIIKLAHDNPGEIRNALLPVLAKTQGKRARIRGGIAGIGGPIRKAVTQAGDQIIGALREIGVVEKVLLDWVPKGGDLVCEIWFQGAIEDKGEAEQIVQEALGVPVRASGSHHSGWEVSIHLNIRP